MDRLEVLDRMMGDVGRVMVERGYGYGDAGKCGELRGRVRKRNAVWGRSVFYAVGHSLGYTYEEMAGSLGLRHVSVHHALKDIVSLYDIDRRYRAFYDAVKGGLDVDGYRKMLEEVGRMDEEVPCGVSTKDECERCAKSLMRISRYAARCGVSTMTIYKWRNLGLLRIVVIDGVNFVLMDEGARNRIVTRKERKDNDIDVTMTEKENENDCD